jgi:hypothetical protein
MAAAFAKRSSRQERHHESESKRSYLSPLDEFAPRVERRRLRERGARTEQRCHSPQTLGATTTALGSIELVHGAPDV